MNQIRATTRSSGGTSRVPRRNAATRTTAEISSDSAMPKPPPRWPAMTGMSASIGARLKSWTIPRPSATRACGALHLSPAQEGLERDDRAGDGEGTTEQESCTQRPATRQAGRGSQDHRQRDLDCATQQRGAADADHFAEGELDTQPEHQQRNAEIRQQLYPIHVGHQTGRVRPDGQPREDVPD